MKTNILKLTPVLLLLVGALVAFACRSSPGPAYVTGASTSFPTTGPTNILAQGDTYANDITSAVNALQASVNTDLSTLNVSRLTSVQCLSDAGNTCTLSVPLALNEAQVQYLWINESAGKNGQQCKYSIGVKCGGDAGSCVVFRASNALEACNYTDAGADASWFTPAIGIDAGYTRVKLGGQARLSVQLDGGDPVNKVTYQVFQAP